MADNTLSGELECAICSDQLEQPKFIGPCNHTFCRNCIDQLWESRGRIRRVPCPQCREQCPIPSNGAGGLKDNFMAANIIETYRNQQQRAANLKGDKCTLCPNRASCLCKDCDLKLCPKCKQKHDRDTRKRYHDLFGLCPSHFSGLLFFCTSCNQAICGVCRVSNHDEGDHHVTPIGPVVDNLVSGIQASSTELEAAGRLRFGEQLKKLLQLRDIVQKTSTSAESHATSGAEGTIAKKKDEIRCLNAKSQSIQMDINALVKEKEELDERTKQLINDVGKLERDNKKIIAAVRERFAKLSKEINKRLQSLETSSKDITTRLEQGRAVRSTKISFEKESISTLASINQALQDLVRASRKCYTRTVIEKAGKLIRELGLDIGEFGEAIVEMSGDHQIKRSTTERVFRQLKKVCNVTFPKDQPFKKLFRVKKYLDESAGFLATLCNSRSNVADTMQYFYKEGSSSFARTIRGDVHPAFDMAVSSTGEVVVARREKPPIRLFNPSTGAYHDINIKHKGKMISDLWHIETDESDNMLVLTGFYDPLLLALKKNGNVIESLQLRCDETYHMAFCSLNRILYVSAGDRILRFRWSNNSLTEISSSSHGVAGFKCADVCIGSGGEVLVTGKMGNDDIVIYQVTEGEDGRNLVWREIKYQDGVKRRCTRDSVPHICISGDNLWLGYDDGIEKFKLE